MLITELSAVQGQLKQLTFDTMFIPIASPVVATNLMNNKRPATTPFTDCNLANLQQQKKCGPKKYYIIIK